MVLTKKIEDMTLQEMFQVVMEQYHTVKNTPWGNSNPEWHQWQALKTSMVKKIIQNSGVDFSDTYVTNMTKNGDAPLSGSGKWADIFGIDVRHKSVPSVKKGVYITYLFNRSTQCAYLTLAQGASEYRNNPKALAARVNVLRDQLKLDPALTAAIKTGSDAYDAGTIASKEYTLTTLPDDATLYQDLKNMVDIYEQYLSIESPASPATPTATYTDNQLCRILGVMLDDAQALSRKNAALATFGAVYGAFIHKDNTQRLLDVTAKTGNRSNEQQLGSGRNLHKLCQNTPGMDLFEVLDATTATAKDLQDLLAKDHAAAPAGAKDATTIRFGIRYCKTIAANNLKTSNIYGDGGLVALGCQMVEFIEKFPQYKVPLCEIPAYENKYATILRQSMNVIFRGAPGTGKTHLAKEIAAILVSNGEENKYENLSQSQKQQIGFVQFHPSYDYSDFVEGLRPIAENGKMGFELRPGIFKEFVERAKQNLENSKKSPSDFEKEQNIEQQLDAFLDQCQIANTELETLRGTKFTIEDSDEQFVYVHIPDNEQNELKISRNEITKLLAADQTFNTIKDVRNFFGKKHNTQQFSYVHSIYKGVSEAAPITTKKESQHEVRKDYVFIIDEINRGEISKILGELFFSIDPGYRGVEGAVFTQYANLHTNPDEKFYIPENVYIIGTMNDIDRSVDTFDFAMRRRFRFIEIKADENTEMLDCLGARQRETISRMRALNKKIAETDGLNENYQIGAAYFKKLENDLTFDQLWTDYLEPLLQEYVNGMYEAKSIMQDFKKAYGYNDLTETVAEDAAVGNNEESVAHED